jgi:hypothetical protein
MIICWCPWLTPSERWRSCTSWPRTAGGTGLHRSSCCAANGPRTARPSWPSPPRHGVGSALLHETVARANAAGERGIALLGDPAYYSRFGFGPATSRGVDPPDPAWGGYFQLLPLAGWPGGASGTFRYARPFTGR